MNTRNTGIVIFHPFNPINAGLRVDKSTPLILASLWDQVLDFQDKKRMIFCLHLVKIVFWLSCKAAISQNLHDSVLPLRACLAGGTFRETRQAPLSIALKNVLRESKQQQQQHLWLQVFQN